MRKQDFHLGLPYLAAFAFILAMVAAAVYFNDPEIILPEMAAMAVALWVWQEKSWMQRTEMIFILPSLTALLGFGINMLEFSYLTKLFLVLSGMAILMAGLKFAFPPALATGFLPIVTNAVHWSFIYAIIITSFVLMVVVMAGKRYRDIPIKTDWDGKRLWAYFGITVLWILAAYATELVPIIIIPPITVVVFETLGMKMFSLGAAVKIIAALCLSITMSVYLKAHIENWILLSAVLLPLMYLLLSVFRIRIPAVYAFPFLIFVLPGEKVAHLPVASLIVSIFSFGLVLSYHHFLPKLSILKTFRKQL